MAPKHPSPSSKKAQSSLRQSTLAFKTRKSGGALPPKAKAKANSRLKKEREKSISESEAEREIIVTQNSDSEEDEVSHEKKDIDLEDRAKLYERYYRETQKKRGLPPIHNEGQTKVHKMLRVFDNTYECGPCLGLTRMQRWERAEAMGLHPPIEVRDILLSKQGSEDSSLVHNVFHELV